MGISDAVQNFLFGIMLKKGLSMAIKVCIGFITSVGVVDVLGKYGINVDINTAALEGSITVLVASLLEMARNYLKQKYPAIGKYL